MKKHWRFLVFMALMFICAAQAWSQKIGDPLEGFPETHWGDSIGQSGPAFTVPKGWKWEDPYYTPTGKIDHSKNVNYPLVDGNEREFLFTFGPDNKLFRLTETRPKEEFSGVYGDLFYSPKVTDVSVYPAGTYDFFMIDYANGDIVIIRSPKAGRYFYIIRQVTSRP